MKWEYLMVRLDMPTTLEIETGTTPPFSIFAISTNTEAKAALGLKGEHEDIGEPLNALGELGWELVSMAPWATRREDVVPDPRWLAARRKAHADKVGVWEALSAIEDEEFADEPPIQTTLVDAYQLVFKRPKPE